MTAIRIEADVPQRQFRRKPALSRDYILSMFPGAYSWIRLIRET